ncbi:hypothetical protein [Cochleicola gelatinilyticus]|uniref:Lipoprotein n=1 Tax=Cochleicola gelatinilyticus TaxID=1763537 RepID=A0A167IKS6_9FLAO|nr:hypothetical protein [Cochleicola gelatinilyticus]OAB79754.1 hypothetical protein ULVI_03135 [Cochleicola gelatinilyticus]
MKYSPNYFKVYVTIYKIGFLILFIISLLMSSCAITSKKGGEFKSEDTAATSKNENTTKNITAFDFSKIREHDISGNWVPIDPSKPMSVSTVDGTTVSQNAKHSYNNNKKATDKNIETNIEETKDSEEISEKTKIEQRSWWQKLKISVPWYVFFFGFLFLAVFGFMYLQSRKTSAIVKLLKAKTPEL